MAKEYSRSSTDRQGNKTTKTFRDGKMSNVRHTSGTTGKSHDHKVSHGFFGPGTGKRKN